LVIYIIEQETDGPIVTIFDLSTMEPYGVNAYFDKLSGSFVAD